MRVLRQVAVSQCLIACVVQDEPSASYDPVGLSAFLERLSDFDERMNGVVEDSGILTGERRRCLGCCEAFASAEPTPVCKGSIAEAVVKGCSATTGGAGMGQRLGGSAVQMECVETRYHVVIPMMPAFDQWPSGIEVCACPARL